MLGWFPIQNQILVRSDPLGRPDAFQTSAERFSFKFLIILSHLWLFYAKLWCLQKQPLPPEEDDDAYTEYRGHVTPADVFTHFPRADD